MSSPGSPRGRGGPDTPEPARSDGSEQEPGVFGSLPRTRPAVRSPRRPEPPAPEPETPREASADGDGAAREGREAEVEALARAGISLAGEAATLGLRLAGRAATALRDAVERR